MTPLDKTKIHCELHLYPDPFYEFEGRWDRMHGHWALTGRYTQTTEPRGNLADLGPACFIGHVTVHMLLPRFTNEDLPKFHQQIFDRAEKAFNDGEFQTIDKPPKSIWIDAIV